jgi:hypothetical protein
MRPGELSTSGIPQGMSGEELMKEKLARNGLGGGKMMATGSVRTVTHNKLQSKLDLLQYCRHNFLSAPPTKIDQSESKPDSICTTFHHICHVKKLRLEFFCQAHNWM